MTKRPSTLREAIRFAEEYGFREWLRAQEQLNALESQLRSLTEENERSRKALIEHHDTGKTFAVDDWGKRYPICVNLLMDGPE